MDRHTNNNSQRGVATLEFTFVAGIFFIMIVAIVAGGNLFWTHNALVEATRRGARYAANQCNPGATPCPGYSTAVERIKNVVVYNTPTTGTTPFVPYLQPSNVTVTYSTDPTGIHPENAFGVGSGTVSVKIQDFDYHFPLWGIVIHMPPYQTTVQGENAGFIPLDE
jgi:Flp pilus assembly protein TadG